MSDLKEFQAEAVKRILEQLYADNGSGRFLLADEVGLGKTMVARGVLKALRERNPGRRGHVCVYLCSNLEIADQNRDKLSDERTNEPPTRLTLIPKRAVAIQAARKIGRSQLFVFTPGTSLHLLGNTGMKEERRMLLACLYGWRAHRIGAKLAEWTEFFRCGAGQSSSKTLKQWQSSCEPYELRKLVVGIKESGLYRKLRARWNRAKVSVRRHGETVSSERALLDALYDAVPELAAGSNDKAERRRISRNRATLIGALRKGVAEAAIDFLAPDLVLVDEFQRFKEVVDLAENTDELAGRLFSGVGKPPRVLILSATPYKAVTFDHEQDDHYKDFQRTLSFLLGNRRDKKDWLAEVDSHLREFKAQLTGDDVKLPALIALKDKLEGRLREVMCRTERSRYVFDEQKGVEEHPDFHTQEKLPAPDVEALTEFVSLRAFLAKHENGERPFPSIVDFWKSCSSVISFMDAGYVLINDLKKRNVRIAAPLLRQEAELQGLSHRNLKLQTLTARVREAAGAVVGKGGRWRYLWMRPTYHYYEDQFFGDADPTKFLVFSRWRFVPKAIAFVVSSEFENTSTRRRPKSKQAIDLKSAECLRTCLPLVSLADLVDPAAWSARERASQGEAEPSVAELRRFVRKELLRSLKAAGIPIVRRAARKNYWPALFALERVHLKSVLLDGSGCVPDWEDVLQGAVETKGTDAEGSQQAKEFLSRVRPWVAADVDDGDGGIVFPGSMLEEAVNLVLGSPAIGVMRATRALFGDSAVVELESVARLCFTQLRAYFNKGYVQGIVRRHARAGRYADRVMRYCADAHFQAVIDEYSYLVRRVLQRNDLEQFLEHIGRVLAVDAGTPNINVPTRSGGRIQERRSQRPVHFALAFGEENQPDASLVSRASRKTSVRESFNSPFWPFVLATTSVGQEGLDFHLYCRDVMHWNLPSNPVDLEQREGRINRFDGLVVRRNIAVDHSLASIKRTGDVNQSFWDRVFAEVSAHPTGNQHLKHGLFPHWVFEPIHGKPVRIRRHLAIFEGSRDRAHYERLKKYLFYYRLAFGQARQQDLLDRIVDRPDEQKLRRELEACMINLSPFEATHSWKKAQDDSRHWMAKPERLRSLIHETRAIFHRRRDELKEVSDDLERFWDTTERLAVQAGGESPGDTLRVAALVYLLNPFDATFDRLVGHGLADGVRIIREVGRIA